MEKIDIILGIPDLNSPQEVCLKTIDKIQSIINTKIATREIIISPMKVSECFNLLYNNSLNNNHTDIQDLMALSKITDGKTIPKLILKITLYIKSHGNLWKIKKKSTGYTLIPIS